MAWLLSNFGYIVNDFEIDMWGIGNICEYHENICRPAGAATYTDYEDCLALIRALPRYSAACGPNRPLAGNSLGCKFKHHFMAAIVPETHCKHIGPENTVDGEGDLKCVDIMECPAQFPQAAYQHLLDGTAQVLGEPIGSNYVDHDFAVSTDLVYAAAQLLTNTAYTSQGWQPPVLC
jgi:hypothetical protein